MPDKVSPILLKLKHTTRKNEEKPFRGELFNIEQLVQHAQNLAAEQQLVGGTRNNFLPERLSYNDDIIRNFNNETLKFAKSQHITLATEWLVDNFYLIEEHIQLARRHFPKKYNRELPCLVKGSNKGLPRVYDVIIEFITHVDAQIDEEPLQEFFKAYQTQSILKLGELWAVPIMLRLALIENLQRIATRLQVNQQHRDFADLWVDKLEDVMTKKASQLVVVVSDMAKSDIPLTSSFVSEFCQRLSSQNSALQIARKWLEERLTEDGLSIEAMIHDESQNQAADQLSVSHSVKSLRFLNDTDWKVFVEKLSVVEQILQQDPAKVYGQMDFATRDHYRHIVELLAQKSKFKEIEVARHVNLLADKALKQGQDKRHTHGGYYLIGDGSSILNHVIGIKRTLKSTIKTIAKSSPLFFYAGFITLFSILGTIAVVYLIKSPEIPLTDWRFILLSLFLFISISQSAVFLVNWISTLLIKPDVLPRLDFSEGIAPDCLTVVVIPTIISHEEGVDQLLKTLELHYLSNRGAYLHFGLLTDFADALNENEDADTYLLERTQAGVIRLNQQYAAGNDSLFYLFHRPRRWNPKENVWMGYERKRGKLMEFNTFLKEGDARCFSLVEGNTTILKKVKYVITLDTDTQLPPDTAHKLVGAMAHLLNQPEYDFKRNVVVKGYGILQPRVATSLSSNQSPIYSRLFTDDAGIDPYTRTVSDVYQDIFHEGSFIGKGIYDVDAFEQVLANRFPENKILSHDLLESTYVRSALISDVELYESYPSGYQMDAKRRHRWIRGDWQIIQWILPHVPTLNNGSSANPIAGLGRWKIFDNLRRSMVSPAILLFLTLYCMLFPQNVWSGLIFLSTIIIFPFIFSLSSRILFKAGDQSWIFHIREIVLKSRQQLKQILFSLVVLPYEAYLNTDAILRTLWRLIISRKNLMKWQASVDTERTVPNSLASFYYRMWFSPVMAVIFTISLSVYNPVSLYYILPFLLIWFAAPYIAWYVSCPVKQKASDLTKEQELLLHRIARKTWHFFEVFVNANENWLPPDNYQETPNPTVASRTSPTNIGVSLLANLAAYDFGYLSAGGAIERIQQTFATMTSLKKFKGHLYNWYDTRTLEPLFPMYISSVDSGNLAGHLLVLAQGLKDMSENKICSPVIFEGLLDTVRVMRHLDHKNMELKQLEKELLQATPITLHEIFHLLNLTKKQMDVVIHSLSHADEILQSWGQVLIKNCNDYLEDLLFIAPWINIGHTKEMTNTFLIHPVFYFINEVPTLKDIAGFDDLVCPFVENLLNQLQATEEEVRRLSEWLNCLKTAARHANQRIHILNVLARQSENFAEMDFSFLYNPFKKLFTIGYNVVEQRADSGSYDMLASEARLCSYVAIAQRQVPLEHWFSLSRLLILPQGKPILLSWSGSMFEYLMPLLVMPSFDKTLLDQTYKGVIGEQIGYGKKFKVPWGISESGFNRTDTFFNYQYKAFGIPSLGLKRGLSEDLVIAPYATLLALMVAPRKACENMQRLSAGGHESTFGYYEAIDYTPTHLPLNETSADVRSFMAHHQGMGLLSMVNLMKGNVMQQRFLSCPMLKAYELLLQENIPHGVMANVISDDSKFEIEGLNPILTESIHRIFKDTNITPEVNLLSNGRYQVMVNNTGGGYSRWNNMAVTRWREDATNDCRGLFIYLRDTDTGDVWSVGHQPTLGVIKDYEVKFTQAYAEFNQRHLGLHIRTTICVSPEDDIELRRVKITNYSNKTRTIELTTYSEVVIAPQDSDEAHPAFSNLFIQTQFNPASSSLICTRRARSEEEKPPYLLHLMLAQSDQGNDISCETDRSLFIGRGRSQVNPLAMEQPGALSGSEGSVLDPVMSLRRTVTIPAGGTTVVCIALGMSENQVDVMSIADKYQNIRMTDRAFELAWTHSQIVLYQLNITEVEAQLYAKLAGALIYMNPSYRADPSVLKDNRRGQNGLWGYSISGDVPLVLLRINDMNGVELVRQLVLAHAYWRMKGLIVELVILNEDTSLYRQSLHDEIISLISTGVEAPLLENSGGIFVRRMEQMPHEDVLLLQSAARVVLSNEQGTLFDQLEINKLTELKTPVLHPERVKKTNTETPLLPRDLIFENGYGGFTRDGHEYVITLHPGQSTPAPWCNVMANEHFGTVVSESGGAYTWAENAHELRLTPWNNDTVQDVSGEAFYIRDEQTGQYWSPTPLPARGKTPYVIRHGFGYTVFEHSENGIKSELWVYVAKEASVKFSILKIRNVSGSKRRISVTGYYEWVLADRRSKSLLHVQTEIDIETGVLFARNFYNSDFPGHIGFIDVGEPRTVTGDRKEFIGQNGNLADPEAMKRTRLSGKTGAGMDSCGAVQVVFDLDEGQERETRFRMGFAHNKKEMRQLVSQYRLVGASRGALEGVWNYWNHTLGTINVDTPDPSVNVMANGWLLYQTLSSRVWARSGFYQSGGAYGFRDQLQDVMALVHAEPAITRQQILRAAAHQFKRGDVQHWWHPPMDRGVRTHFSDDYLWLPYVTCRYISSVADMGILDEKIPFIEGRELRPDEESYYDMPTRSDEVATLYEHCMRSIRYGLKFGIHGLPLMGCGDWNDGMNLVGKDGKGESVWLAFFLYDVLMKFSVVAKLNNDERYSNYCIEQAEELRMNIKKHAWDGEWYRRAYFDNGEPLGSKQNEECSIDSIPQSWSVISGAGDKERSETAMGYVDRQLVNREAKLIQLFSPPFDKSALNPGYIKGYIPGVRENGGQYTHAAIWTSLAFAIVGETDKAWELFDLLNPVQHGATPAQIDIYKVEPYVVAADVYATPQHVGRGGWTWYTGSASWMYSLLIETLLGVRRSGNILHLSPHLKKEWNSYKIHYRYYETVYHITIHRIMNQSRPFVLLDKKQQESINTITMTDDRNVHFVEMWVK